MTSKNAEDKIILIKIYIHEHTQRHTHIPPLSLSLYIYIYMNAHYSATNFQNVEMLVLFLNEKETI